MFYDGIPCPKGHTQRYISTRRCVVCQHDRTKTYEAKSRDKALTRLREWREQNRERSNALSRKWHAANLSQVRELKRKRRSQTPKWANRKQMAVFYRTARAVTSLLGQLYHVDHIVPLEGKLVCGLHVEYNLQILPAKENQVKGNRHAE